jgi:hypothetical protein
MTALVVNETIIEPVCPTRTSDIVAVVRRCAARLESAGLHLHAGKSPVEQIIASIQEGLGAVGNGVVLLMLQIVEFTDPDLPEQRKVTVRGVPYGQRRGGFDFHSVSEAMKKTLRSDLGSDPDQHGSNRVTLLASLILTNSDSACGQLSHPGLLRQELENVEEVCASVASSHQVRLLESLSNACREAHRAGALVAAVQIRDVDGEEGLGLRFESFYADSEELFKVEQLRRRGAGTCVSLRVRQHDVPR